MATRKHFYLITEHYDEERVGLIKVTDSRIETMRKNEERTGQLLIHETNEFSEYKAVSLGYVDFESEDDYEDNFGDAVEEKFDEIDDKWIEKAGHEPEEVSA